MAHNDPQVTRLINAQGLFNALTDCLEPDDAGFAPAEGIFTTSQHVAHAAQFVDRLNAALKGEPFETDADALARRVREVNDLGAARSWWNQSIGTAIRMAMDMAEDDWNDPVPPGSSWGGHPRRVVVDAICEHTAHHRGALAVYARMCGRQPAMIWP